MQASADSATRVVNGLLGGADSGPSSSAAPRPRPLPTRPARSDSTVAQRPVRRAGRAAAAALSAAFRDGDGAEVEGEEYRDGQDEQESGALATGAGAGASSAGAGAGEEGDDYRPSQRGGAGRRARGTINFGPASEGQAQAGRPLSGRQARAVVVGGEVSDGNNDEDALPYDGNGDYCGAGSAGTHGGIVFESPSAASAGGRSAAQSAASARNASSSSASAAGVLVPGGLERGTTPRSSTASALALLAGAALPQGPGALLLGAPAVDASGRRKGRHASRGPVGASSSAQHDDAESEEEEEEDAAAAGTHAGGKVGSTGRRKGTVAVPAAGAAQSHLEGEEEVAGMMHGTQPHGGTGVMQVGRGRRRGKGTSAADVQLSQPSIAVPPMHTGSAHGPTARFLGPGAGLLQQPTLLPIGVGGRLPLDSVAPADSAIPGGASTAGPGELGAFPRGPAAGAIGAFPGLLSVGGPGRGLQLGLGLPLPGHGLGLPVGVGGPQAGMSRMPGLASLLDLSASPVPAGLYGAGGGGGGIGGGMGGSGHGGALAGVPGSAEFGQLLAAQAASHSFPLGGPAAVKAAMQATSGQPGPSVAGAGQVGGAQPQQALIDALMKAQAQVRGDVGAAAAAAGSASEPVAAAATGAGGLPADSLQALAAATATGQPQQLEQAYQLVAQNLVQQQMQQLQGLQQLRHAIDVKKREASTGGSSTAGAGAGGVSPRTAAALGSGPDSGLSAASTIALPSVAPSVMPSRPPSTTASEAASRQTSASRPPGPISDAEAAAALLQPGGASDLAQAPPQAEGKPRLFTDGLSGNLGLAVSQAIGGAIAAAAGRGAPPLPSVTGLGLGGTNMGMNMNLGGFMPQGGLLSIISRPSGGYGGAGGNSQFANMALSPFPGGVSAGAGAGNLPRFGGSLPLGLGAVGGGAGSGSAGGSGGIVVDSARSGTDSALGLPSVLGGGGSSAVGGARHGHGVGTGASGAIEAGRRSAALPYVPPPTPFTVGSSFSAGGEPSQLQGQQSGGGNGGFPAAGAAGPWPGAGESNAGAIGGTGSGGSGAGAGAGVGAGTGSSAASGGAAFAFPQAGALTDLFASVARTVTAGGGAGMGGGGAAGLSTDAFRIGGLATDGTGTGTAASQAAAAVAAFAARASVAVGSATVGSAADFESQPLAALPRPSPTRLQSQLGTGAGLDGSRTAPPTPPAGAVSGFVRGREAMFAPAEVPAAGAATTSGSGAGSIDAEAGGLPAQAAAQELSASAGGAAQFETGPPSAQRRRVDEGGGSGPPSFMPVTVVTQQHLPVDR